MLSDILGGKLFLRSSECHKKNVKIYAKVYGSLHAEAFFGNFSEEMPLE